jgi:glycosyltransferase involved in cell wall biosynthesis
MRCAGREHWNALGHRLLLRGFDSFLRWQSNREFYRQAGIPARRIHDCPHFIDNERFCAHAQALRPRREELRRDWAIPGDATCFLFSGKLIREEASPRSTGGACDVPVPQRPSIHLLVVGTGELIAQARAIAAAERLPVTFAGFLNQTEIVRAYVAADCLCCPPIPVKRGAWS